MPKLLLTVEDVFEVKGRGVIVVPTIPEHELPQGPRPLVGVEFLVCVRSARGVLENVEAVFTLMMGVGAPQYPHAYTCFLKGINKASVPVGTAIYTQD